VTVKAIPFLDGLIGGLIGAAVVAIWFLFLDAVSGLPLYAPTVLGTGLFVGPEALSSNDAAQFSLKLTLMYTWVHGIVFVVLGEIAVYLLLFTGKTSDFGFFLLLFVVLEFGFVGTAFVLARPVLYDLTWPAVLLGNLLAAAGMACYFRLRYPKVVVALQHTNSNEIPRPRTGSDR
jgi:hypothetical protein